MAPCTRYCCRQIPRPTRRGSTLPSSWLIERTQLRSHSRPLPVSASKIYPLSHTLPCTQCRSESTKKTGDILMCTAPKAPAGTPGREQTRHARYQHHAACLSQAEARSGLLLFISPDPAWCALFLRSRHQNRPGPLAPVLPANHAAPCSRGIPQEAPPPAIHGSRPG